jgi:hypothetical protein
VRPGTALNNECLLHMSRLWPKRIRAWRRNTGGAVINGQFVRFGQGGEADLDGIIAPNGRRLAIETKVKDKMSGDQVSFARMVRSMGGVYLVVRSTEELERKLMPFMGCVDEDLTVEEKEALKMAGIEAGREMERLVRE